MLQCLGIKKDRKCKKYLYPPNKLYYVAQGQGWDILSEHYFRAKKEFASLISFQYRNVVVFLLVHMVYPQRYWVRE